MMMSQISEEKPAPDHGPLLAMTGQIVAGYVKANQLAPSQLPELIDLVYRSLLTVGQPAKQEAAAERQVPAVSIRKSVTPAYIICLEDGRQLKMLKRHLRTTYGMTPDDYRAKWNLPPDYPMVAPDYAARRSEFAKTIGLGRSGKRKSSRGTQRAKAA
jgi:predicted transcriptional regulator